MSVWRGSCSGDDNLVSIFRYVVSPGLIESSVSTGVIVAVFLAGRVVAGESQGCSTSSLISCGRGGAASVLGGLQFRIQALEEGRQQEGRQQLGRMTNVKDQVL